MLAFRIDGVFVNTRRTAGCKDNALTSDNGKSTVSEPRIAFVADENIYIEPLTKSVLNDITL